MTPTAQQIIEAVAEVSGLDVTQIRAGTKTVSHVRARWAAMLLISQLTQKTRQQTARELRLLNHTTVTHGVREGLALQAICTDYANMLLDARRIALERATGAPLDAKPKAMATKAPEPELIPPCLNVLPFRPKREGPRAWLPPSDPEWCAENEARFCAVMSVAHPETIVWDFVRLRRA